MTFISPPDPPEDLMLPFRHQALIAHAEQVEADARRLDGCERQEGFREAIAARAAALRIERVAS